MQLDPEQKAIGQENYIEALSMSRRDFLAGAVAGGVVAAGGTGAMYFGYNKVSEPLRVGVVGTGDEGQVLIGACNPDYVNVVAIADIRPSSVHRAFHGDYKSSGEPVPPRPGLMKVYDWKTEEEARKHVKVYTDYNDLLNDSDVEAVIIAVPLHLHSKVAIDAMNKGKHVLTEKLMAQTAGQCKEMCLAADDNNVILAVGHQRHYSVLYENAVHLIQNMFLGELHSIRAQWHRNNLPGSDSWQPPLPSGETDDAGKVVVNIVAGQLKWLKDKLSKERDPGKKANYAAAVAQFEVLLKEAELELADYNYKQFRLADGRVVPPLEELIRWRLWNRTGGGIMAELGSHQLDAAGIFISSLHNKGVPRHKWHMVHPLAVHVVGGRSVFPLNREIGDHVYCMFEFPAPGYDPVAPEEKDEKKRIALAEKRFGYYDRVNGEPMNGIEPYDKDPNKRIVYTYSSINGCGFGGYGEIVMGTKRTLVLEQEQDVMLYDNKDTSSKLKMDDAAGAVIDTQASGPPVAVAKAATGPVSRGYKEEIEHWAFCIKNRDPENMPRCHGKVALGDAVVALTTNMALRRSIRSQPGDKMPGFVEFKPEWFDYHNPATPDDEIKV